jgi:Na+-transporting NADH:ubiquinone oxidoreductase subunit NqrA
MPRCVPQKQGKRFSSNHPAQFVGTVVHFLYGSAAMKTVYHDG